MLQDAHSRKISIPVTTILTGGDIIVAAIPNTWIYIHELIGAFNGASDTLIIKAGTRTLAHFDLADGQGLTEQDEPGEDNRPRFECKPGEDFILDSVGGTPFIGALHYSLRT